MSFSVPENSCGDYMGGEDRWMQGIIMVVRAVMEVATMGGERIQSSDSKRHICGSNIIDGRAGRGGTEIKKMKMQRS
jgi:hypothetical protein